MTDDTKNTTPNAEPAQADPAPPTPEPTSPTETAPPAEQTTNVIPEVSQSTPASTIEPAVSEPVSIEQQTTTPIPASVSVQQTPAAQSTPTSEPDKWSAADRAQAVATHVRKKELRLAKIIEYVREHKRITNNGIEKLIHVSDATASRYAKILVAQGLLLREGKGRSAAYVLPG